MTAYKLFGPLLRDFSFTIGLEIDFVTFLSIGKETKKAWIECLAIWPFRAFLRNKLESRDDIALRNLNEKFY